MSKTLLLFGVVSLVASAACTSTSIEQQTTCFAWPEAACPDPRIAPLYLRDEDGGDFVERDGCGVSLVTIDEVLPRADDRCCYRVTVERKSCPPDAIL